MKAEIRTAKGTMHVDLYDKEVKNTVDNFVKLAKSGFYDGLRFHRVGGPGWTIKCETNAERQYHDRGVLSMAHAGKDTGGSQFFICHNRENTQHLDGVHTCFGRVEEQDWPVIDAIRPGDLIEKITIVE